MSLAVRIVGDHIEPIGDPPAVHDFPRKWVDRYVEQGVVSLSRGRIVLHGADTDVAYTILRRPGVYCVACGVRLADAPSADPAVTEGFRTHVDGCDGDSPADPENPAGYLATAAYRTELEA